MSTFGSSGVVRIRRSAQRRLKRLAVRSPFVRWPATWVRYAAWVRVKEATRIHEADPAGALRMLAPVQAAGLASLDAWRLIVDAHQRTGGLDPALAAAQHAAESEDANADDAIQYKQLAEAGGDAEHLSAAIDLLLAATPQNRSQLDRMALALRTADLRSVNKFVERIASSMKTAQIRSARLDETVAELRLIDVLTNSPSEFAGERARLQLGPEQALAVAMRACARTSSWRTLAEVMPAATDQIDAPLVLLRNTAKKASRAGWTSLAGQLTAQMLRTEPDDQEILLVQNEAADIAGLLRDGWKPPAPRAEPAYESAAGSVLLALGQSLPIRSGGYSTRSHGILTSLSQQGWAVCGVTRLGFPFDLWWGADDLREVPVSDVVDGITYHRLLRDAVREYPRVPLLPYVEECADGIARIARERRAGVIHAASLYDVGMAGLVAARRLGLPFIYEMRGLKQLLEVSRDASYHGSERFRLLEMLETDVARQADHLLVITDALKREMVRNGVDESRISVVPNGVHTSRFTSRDRDAELEKQLGVAGKTVIGYIGGLVHYEGLELLLEAAARLGTQRNDFHVLIVGDGAHEKELHAEARRLQLGDILTFTGRVPHGDVERYLSLVDIAPIPRSPVPVCELISPIKPFEAMAMGKVVVTSDVAALAEIVQDDVTGRTFRKGDAADLTHVLGQLIDSPRERERLATTARVWVEKERDWATITERVGRIYKLLGV